MNKLLKKFRLGWKSGKPRDKKFPDDILEKEFWELYRFCSPFTMTSVERMYALFQAVKYVIANNIPGYFVECGVWRGGSAMLIAKYLSLKNIKDRKVILYDTYEGMSEPTEIDKDFRGVTAVRQLKESPKNEESYIWCYASIEDVRSNMLSTGLDQDQVILIKGKVEDTIPSNLPFQKIALLRLDTDWYESTYHELKFLFPLLVTKGVLIIDDFGHWEGCRKAVTEYFQQEKMELLFNRIDETGRLAIKT